MSNRTKHENWPTDQTLANLIHGIAMIKAVERPNWTDATVTPSGKDSMVKMLDMAGSTVQDSGVGSRLKIAGINIHLVPDQVAGVWLFSDKELLRKYLAGDLKELDLMGLLPTGGCRPL